MKLLLRRSPDKIKLLPEVLQEATVGRAATALVFCAAAVDPSLALRGRVEVLADQVIMLPEHMAESKRTSVLPASILPQPRHPRPLL